jgi:hypothetical protein
VAGEIKAYWMGEKIREHPIRFGTATFAKSMNAEPCLTQSRKLLKALNYTGVCEVEYLRDPGDGQYKLIEINARTWLWVGLARACGVDFAKMAYAYVNGMAQPYPETYETGVCWINPWTDTAYAGKAILQGHLSLRTYLDSLVFGKKPARFLKKGCQARDCLSVEYDLLPEKKMIIPYASPNLRCGDVVRALALSETGADKRIKQYFRQLTGKRHVLITNSCRTALFLAYGALEAKGEVITSPLTCQVAIDPIIESGNTPVFRISGWMIFASYPGISRAGSPAAPLPSRPYIWGVFPVTWTALLIWLKKTT